MMVKKGEEGARGTKGAAKRMGGKLLPKRKVAGNLQEKEEVRGRRKGEGERRGLWQRR